MLRGRTCKWSDRKCFNDACGEAHFTHGMWWFPAFHHLDLLVASRARRPLSACKSAWVMQGKQVGWIQDLFVRKAVQLSAAERA